MSLRSVLSRAFHYIVSGVPVKYTTVQVSQISGSKRLGGKNILVTGGGRGLGFSIAQKCIAEGAKVLIVGRKEETLKNACKVMGANSSYVVFDISDAENAERFISDAFFKMNGRIDCLVNNAGISLHEWNFHNVTIDSFDSQIKVNLRGSYFLAKYFAEKIEALEIKKANILFITSERGDQCDDIPYGLTKTAINSFTRGLSRRLYKAMIRVNAVAPGVTASDMTGLSVDGDLTYEGVASGRVFLPEEVAEVAVFLLCDASDCISGEIVHCNAGNHISTWWK
jgi:3-oxoacyl-[acyl-carrier protein] reductase